MLIESARVEVYVMTAVVVMVDCVVAVVWWLIMAVVVIVVVWFEGDSGNGWGRGCDAGGW